MPAIETALADRPGAPIHGTGEASCESTGAAGENAVCDVTGLRARRLPRPPQALREAAAEKL